MMDCPIEKEEIERISSEKNFIKNILYYTFYRGTIIRILT